MTIDEIGTVLFVGAGTMGCANSLVAAVSGYDVVLHDAQSESLDAVPAAHAAIGQFLVQSGYCTSDQLAAAGDRVSVVADLESAVTGVDLVSESVFEDRDLKRDLHRRLDTLAPPSAILTTNTSMLLVSDIEDVVARGNQFAALHSHLGSLLVDIVGGPRTSPATIDVLRRYVQSLGGVPLVLNKEHPGYVFNAMNGPLLATALRLVVEGRASEHDVDRAWMSDRGAPMGPFGMMDLFGLDLILTSWRRPSDDPAREVLRANVEPLLTNHVERGELGMKSGQGFYGHPDPAYQDPGFVSAVPVDAAIADALTTTLVCSAIVLAAEQVATPADIDLAWTAATSLDAGPFAILEQMGTDRLAQLLRRQVADGVVPEATAATVEAFVARRAD